MLIEYKIKFEKDGLTIAQHIEPNSAKPAANGKQQVSGLPATQQEVESAAAGNPLAKIPADGGTPFIDPGGTPFLDPGGTPFLDPGGTPGASASSPIFILGPIIFSNGASPELGKPVEPAADAAQKSIGKAAGQ